MSLSLFNATHVLALDIPVQSVRRTIQSVVAVDTKPTKTLVLRLHFVPTVRETMPLPPGNVQGTKKRL